METIEARRTPFITPGVDGFVSTKADTGSPITRNGIAGEQGDEHWQNLINQLIEWAVYPELVADEGIDAPSRDTVQLAAELALTLKRAGIDCPESIVLDPNGGVVFQYWPRNAPVVYN